MAFRESALESRNLGSEVKGKREMVTKRGPRKTDPNQPDGLPERSKLFEGTPKFLGPPAVLLGGQLQTVDLGASWVSKSQKNTQTKQNKANQTQQTNETSSHFQSTIQIISDMLIHGEANDPLVDAKHVYLF